MIKDLENQTVEVARRDTLTKEIAPIEGLDQYITDLLQTIQQDIFNKAKSFRDEHITKVDTYEEFKKVLEEKGGFISAHWTELRKKRSRLKTKLKLPSDVFLWMQKRKTEFPLSPVSHLKEEYYLQKHINKIL